MEIFGEQPQTRHIQNLMRIWLDPMPPDAHPTNQVTTTHRHVEITQTLPAIQFIFIAESI